MLTASTPYEIWDWHYERDTGIGDFMLRGSGSVVFQSCDFFFRLNTNFPLSTAFSVVTVATLFSIRLICFYIFICNVELTGPAVDFEQSLFCPKIYERVRMQAAKPRAACCAGASTENLFLNTEVFWNRVQPMNVLGLTGLNEKSVWMTELKNSIGPNPLLVIKVEYLPRVYNHSVF